MTSVSPTIDLKSAEVRNQTSAPLVVDLDGTLIATDLLLESFFILAKRNPIRLLMLPVWLVQGLAPLKRHLAREAMPDVHTLPYDQEFLAYLRTEKQKGRSLILATGADEVVANAVAAELNIFDAVFASDGLTNLSGDRKRDRLTAEFGEKGFDYAGHGDGDRTVWSSAQKVILVRPSRGLRDVQLRTSEVDRIFAKKEPSLDVCAHALRLHHWTKNALVLLPLIMAHQLYDAALLARVILAFLAFSLCASSIYLLNDLTDLPEDRRHPHKKQRMLASGRLPVERGAAMIPLLLLVAFTVGLTLSWSFVGVLSLYCALMFAYCLRLRSVAVVDALAVAAGYSLRVVAGAVAVGLAISIWLVIFCVLFFFGLTLLKRYAELVTMHSLHGEKGQARAYVVQDRNRIVIFGCSSGYLSLLILAFYINSDQQVYPRHELIWIIWVLLLYWVSHIWLMAGRGKITGDPVAFALNERVSQIMGILVWAIMLVAA